MRASTILEFLRADRDERALHPRYRSSVVLVAVAGSAASSFTGALLFGALPEIAVDLGTSTSVISWLGIAPAVAFAVSMPLFGKLGDLYGHRNVFIIGWAVAAVLSILAAAAPNAGALIALRTAGQLAGTSTSPAAYGVLARIFAPEERAGPYSRVTVALAISPIVGVAIGGQLVSAIGWRAMFVAQGVVSAIAVVIAIVLLPQTPRRPGVRFDIGGVVTLAVGLTCTLLAVNRVRTWGIDHRGIQSLFIIGVLSLVAFVLIERRVAEPLLSPALFRNRTATSAMGTSAFINSSFNGLDVLTPFAASALFGYATAPIAWINAFRGLGFATGAALARRRLGRWSSRRVVTVGHGIVTVSCGIVGLGTWFENPVLFIGGLVIGAFGTGYGRPSIATSITNAVGDGDAGIANGANNMAHQVGASIGQTALIAIAASAMPRELTWACLVAAALAAASLVTARRLR